VPIPEASTVGIIIGYMISTMFIFFNMLVFVSKREFGQAFTQSLALFPFIGLAMQNMAESGEKVIEKFASKRQKLIGQLKGSDGQGMFAFLGDLIENYTFDPLYEGDPQADALALKQKLEGKFTEISGNLQNALDPEKRGELFQQAQQKFQELKTDPRLQGLKQQAQEKFQELKANPNLQGFREKAQASLDKLKANPQLQGLREKAQERFNKFTQRAGKRLSKKKHKNKKWKTQRKLNK
jgi:multidrug efflux pump subunit AcrB